MIGEDLGSSSPSPAPAPEFILWPRREPFEHGLLPIPKLIFSDGTQTLGPLKEKLLQASPSGWITATELADALPIPLDHARLAFDTLASVHPGDLDPNAGVDVHDLLLFLYIQTYKRLVMRTHKDPAAVADVWPSMSAFDGYLSSMSPIQLARSNSRRFMPSQFDEEAHQLSYLQKHMGNILTLLGESVKGDGDESLVLTSERFDHLGFLIRFGDGITLSQAAPFYANLEPDMPVASVSVATAHEWVLQQICLALENNADKAKENGPATELDAGTGGVCVNLSMSQSSSSPKGSSNLGYAAKSRCQTFIEGISKASVVKQSSDIKGHSVKVLNCQDSVIYILAPLQYAIVYGCCDATIVLGAIGKAVRVEHCERVHVISAAKRFTVANCRECIFFLGVNQQPLFLGDNNKLQVAPYNAFYSHLEAHMAQVGVDATVNRWDEPLVHGLVDSNDAVSHPAGGSDVKAESTTQLDPELFTSFLIPNLFAGESPQSTNQNPFPLPEIYSSSLGRKNSNLSDIKQALRDLKLDESKKQDLASILHVHFRDWLYASGTIRQLYYLQCE
ncbi:putative TBCC domain-containing protein [Dioscorea sansibarensis]